MPTKEKGGPDGPPHSIFSLPLEADAALHKNLSAAVLRDNQIIAYAWLKEWSSTRGVDPNLVG